MKEKRVIKLNEYTAAVVENKSVVLIQQLFRPSEGMMVVTNFEELKQVLKEETNEKDCGGEMGRDETQHDSNN